MGTLRSFFAFILITIMAAVFSRTAAAQCDAGTLYANGAAYAFRSGGEMITYVQAYATGADAEYTTTDLEQFDFINAAPVPNPVTDTVGPGQTAETQRFSTITTTGYGTYDVYGYVSLYDACTGATLPPYDFGGPYTNEASATVVQPTVSGNLTFYQNDFTASDPNWSGSVPVYSNKTTIGANAPGTSGTPTWTFTGSTVGISGSCTSCTGMTLTATLAPMEYGCFPEITASYMVDGLTSAPAGIMILSFWMNNSFSPTTNQPVDNLAVGTTGYISNWYFQMVDSCGTPLQYVNMHEAFSNEMSVYLNTNWFFPTANAWNVSDVGGFLDSVGFAGSSGYMPTPLTPQSPLGSTEVLSATQQFFLDSPITGISLSARKHMQFHYQDHGVDN